MPRLSSSGKHIFPASEVAEFTVCPNAWYLKRLEKHPILDSVSVEKGAALHAQWAKDLEYGFTLGRMLRMLGALCAGATVLVLLLSQR